MEHGSRIMGKNPLYAKMLTYIRYIYLGKELNLTGNLLVSLFTKFSYFLLEEHALLYKKKNNSYTGRLLEVSALNKWKSAKKEKIRKK